MANGVTNGAKNLQKVYVCDIVIWCTTPCRRKYDWSKRQTKQKVSVESKVNCEYGNLKRVGCVLSFSGIMTKWWKSKKLKFPKFKLIVILTLQVGSRAQTTGEDSVSPYPFCNFTPMAYMYQT